MAKTRGWRWSLPALLLAGPAYASGSNLNMTPGVTDISQQVYDLHMTIFWICCAIGAVVFSAMFVSILLHRKSRGVKPATFHESTKVEIIWTAIPVLILIVMAIPATRVLIAMEDTSDSDVTVLITGSQWRWHYEYLDYDINYFSILATPRGQIEGRLPKGENYLLEVDRPLVIPTDKKVRFLMTSDDVIHSWWVPDFAIKKDTNPGFINEAWTQVNEPGIYRGQCAELCGMDHGFMPIVVIAKEPADFEIWAKAEEERIAEIRAEEQRLLALQMNLDEQMELGERVYLAHCAACHQPNGEGLPPMFPALKGNQVATQDRAEHIRVMVDGRPGTSMASFARQLSLRELTSVITYGRNAWGNDTGDVVQAAEVYEYMQGKGSN